ncbi:turripeptide Ici9.2-like [Lucilia sericata]|uniref:turripeptide Ici9.2-like n=1 Tax=Lucilia sericata TaxID=13632 RepID=UPI0018A858AB|nr:turripeptide Ici9.2-like [Lucilia sericata]
MFSLKHLIYLAVLIVSLEMINSSPVVNSACPQICTYEYNPQCVTLYDGSTLEFSNKCLLNVEACKRYMGVKSIKAGHCPQSM